MIKKAAIIGSNGYLGRNMAFFLQQMGVELFCYDIHEKSFLDGCEYHPLDITNYKQVITINQDVDAIFVFAGLTGTEQGFSDYERYIDANEKGLLNILTYLKETKSGARVIFPSTRLVYKGVKDTPLVEEAEKEAKTIYAATKISCESLLKIYHEVFGIDYNIFRVCVPYGNLIPGEPSYGTIGFFMKQAQSGKNISLFGDGGLKRTFTHVADLCSSIFEVINNEATINESYNIGGETHSLKNIALMIARKYHVEIEFKPWPEIALKVESGDTIFDDHKIRSVIETKSYREFEGWLNEN